jgi:hypothetical protein
LGFGVGVLAPIPNPQSPIPNPQSPNFKAFKAFKENNFIIIYIIKLNKN